MLFLLVCNGIINWIAELPFQSSSFIIIILSPYLRHDLVASISYLLAFCFPASNSH